MVFNKKDRAAGTFEKRLACAMRAGESVSVRTNLHKNGSELQVHDTASALFDTAGVLIGFAKVARAIDNNKNGSDADLPGVELAKALGVIAVVFGYIFVLGSLIVGITHLSGISWTWIALGAGLLHIALAVVCVLLAKAN